MFILEYLVWFTLLGMIIVFVFRAANECFKLVRFLPFFFLKSYSSFIKFPKGFIDIQNWNINIWLSDKKFLVSSAYEIDSVDKLGIYISIFSTFHSFHQVDHILFQINTINTSIRDNETALQVTFPFISVLLKKTSSIFSQSFQSTRVIELELHNVMAVWIVYTHKNRYKLN